MTKPIFKAKEVIDKIQVKLNSPVRFFLHIIGRHELSKANRIRHWSFWIDALFGPHWPSWF